MSRILDAMIEKADTALYRAKKTGRIKTYPEGSICRLSLESTIRLWPEIITALSRNYLENSRKKDYHNFSFWEPIVGSHQ